MQVCADEVYEPVGYQVLGYLFLGLSVCAGEAEKIDLELLSACMERFVAVLAVPVVRVALGMGENRPYAFHLQVKYQLVKVPRFLQEGILDQQMVVGQIPDIAASSLRKKSSSIRYSAEWLTSMSFPRLCSSA